jgi:hypothetical protein
MAHDDRGSSPRTHYDQPGQTITERQAASSYDTRSSDRSEVARDMSPARVRNGAGTTALVLGIEAILLVLTVLLVPLGVLLALLAIVFAMVGRSRANRGLATNRRSATGGLVLGVLSLVLGLLLAGAGALAFQQIDDCFGSDVSRSEMRQCIQDQIGS